MRWEPGMEEFVRNMPPIFKLQPRRVLLPANGRGQDQRVFDFIGVCYHKE
jgi:hypothetical protein